MNSPIIAYRANMGIQTSAPFVNTYSLSYDGIDDRVQLSSDFVASGEFTLSFWMKPISAGSPISEIYPIGTFPGNSNYVKLDQIGVMWLRLGGVNAIFNEAVYGGGTNNLVLNDWQNIVFIRDSSNIIRCYRNGVDFGYNVAAATNSNTLTLNSFGRIITNSFGYEGALDEIAFWNTDETSNLSTLSTSPTVDIADLSPTVWLRNGDNGAYKSPQWLIPSNENKDKVSNYSFSFDGIDDKIELGTQSLGITGAISVSAWVRIPTTNTGGGGTNIQQFVCEDRTSGTNRNWALNWRGGGLNRISGIIWDSAGSVVAATTTAIVPNDGIWHHVMFTYTGDTSTDGLKLFVDGIQRAQGTSANGGLRSTTAVVPTIGGLSQTIAQMFEGNIDQVSIFNSVVDIADVWDGSGQPIDVSAVSGIVSNYRMGEEATFSGGVWTVPDAVGSNNGTSNAMDIEDRVGEAPNSDNNALSYNMDLIDRTTDVPT